MAATHRIATRIAFEQHGRLAAFGLRTMDRLIWPLEVWQRLRRRGANDMDAAAQSVGLSAQAYFLQAWWRCTRFGLPPDEYQSFEIFRPERFPWHGDFLFPRHSNRIYAALHDIADRDEMTRAADKAEFAAFCAELQIPAVRNLAVATAGSLEEIEPLNAGAWRGDLIVKPQRGTNGFGVVALHWLGDDRFRMENGRVLDTAGVVAWINDMSRAYPVVVQPRMRNCKHSSKLSGGGLATVRVVTVRFPAGAPQVLAAAIKLPIGSSLVDNFLHGNALAQIDVASGRMASGRRFGRPYQPIDAHPDTEVRFTGEVVPQWQSIVDLACGTHAHFHSLAIMAFDIAPTDAGAVIVEANNRGDFGLVQMAGGRPVGQTDYPRLILAHAERFRRERLRAWNPDWR